jgi:AcrR family transcriptional regulator
MPRAAKSRTQPPDGPRWRRLEGGDRRRQIIAIAQQLFADRAYADVSTTEIAREAGVTHGLLTYHFGSKRNLYLAVLRATLSTPKSPAPVPGTDPDFDTALEDMTEWWLTQLENNPEMWLAVLGGRGLGRDPDVEAFLDDIEERARADLVAYITARDPAEAPPELWALAAAWQGLAEATGVEWLKRGRITRNQAKVLVLESLRRLLKLQALVRRAGETPNGSERETGRPRTAANGSRRAGAQPRAAATAGRPVDPGSAIRTS